MGRGFLFGAVLLSVIFPALAGSASAQEYNHVITVYATVPQQRGIYIDKSGNIIKVAGNTSQNITPQVFDWNHQPVDMTAAIQSQYDAFLKAHDYHLTAGQSYTVSQIVTVSAQASSQTIQVSSAPQAPLKLSVQL